MSFEGVIGKSDFKVIEGENKSWKEKCSVKSPHVAKGVVNMTKTSFAKYIARCGGNEGDPESPTLKNPCDQVITIALERK